MREKALRVADWDDLAELPHTMDRLGDQGEEIFRHAVRWVAQRDGFEPSPVCVLRPLAAGMDLVAAGFEQVDRAFSGPWAELRAGVVRAAHGLRDSDHDAAAAGAVLRRELGG